MGLYAISPHGRYKLLVRKRVEEIRDGQGKLVREYVPPLHAQFEQGGGIPEHVRDIALTRLSFRGLAENEDPFMRMGWFDLDLAAEQNGWDAEQTAAVEEKLRAVNGGESLLIVEQPKTAPPYPRYDEHRKVHGRRTVEHAIAEIVATFGSAGFDVEQAVRYERENGDSAEVIAALEALAADVEVVEEQVIQA